MNTFDLHTDCPTLKTGEKLAIHTLEPPLTGYAGKVDCWWAEIRDELLGGRKPWQKERMVASQQQP